MVAAVKAAADRLCAKQQHNRCAALDFPSFVLNYVICPKEHFIQAVLIWRSASQSAGLIPFSWHDLHRPIIPENLLLHGYIVSLKTPVF